MQVKDPVKYGARGSYAATTATSKKAIGADDYPEDSMIAAPSYGSNCNRYSQSRKVSIGIVAEPIPTTGLRSTDEDVLRVPTTAEFNTQKGRQSTNGLEATATVPSEAREQFGSHTMKMTAVFSTPLGNSFQAKVTASKNERNSKDPNGVKGAPLLQPLHLFSNGCAKMGKLDGFVDKRNGNGIGYEREDAATGDNTKEKLGGFVDRRNGKENEGTATGETLVFTGAQEIHTSNSRRAADKGEVPPNGKTEVLRMKLMELMATISSPTKSILQPPDVGRTSPQPAQTQNQMDDIAPMRQKCSDTIEADTESPDCTNKRPVTQSLPRKRASGKMQPEKLRHTIQSAKKPEIRNIPSEEGLPGGVQGNSHLSYKTFTRKSNSKKKQCVTTPYKTSVQVQENKDKIEEMTGRNAKLLPAERTFVPGPRLLGTRLKNSRSLGKQSVKQPSKQELNKQEVENNQPETHEQPKHNGRSLSSGYVVGHQNDLESLKSVKTKLPGTEPHKVSVQQNENLRQQSTNKNGNSLSLNKTSSSSFSRGGLPPFYSVIDKKDAAKEKSPVSTNCIEQPLARNLSLKKDTMAPALQVNEEVAPAVSPHKDSFSHGSIRGRLDKVRPVIINKDTSLNNTAEKKSFEKQGKFSFQEQVNSPGSSVNLNHRGQRSQSSEKDSMDPKDVAESPTFGRSPNVGNSPGSLPEEAEMEQGASSPPTLSEKIFRRSSIFKFETFSSKVSLHNQKNETRKPQDSPFVHPVPHMKEKDAESSSPSSSTDDSGSENSDEGSQEDAPSPKSVPTQKPKFMRHRAKKLRSCEDTLYEEQNPISFSPKRSPENMSKQETMPQDVEDGLTSAVGMLALALEKLKNKVKLLTNKKSSEILASVAEAMQAQFHNVESQIQTDTSKLTNLSKHKRKRVETEFQETEEQLKKIHENFRKEINQLLEGCKGTIEGLEENHVELKGVLEKQKTSHRKLLVQAQEAVETQLHDAEKRITSINKSAREQMHKLKLVIAECLEGVMQS